MMPESTVTAKLQKLDFPPSFMIGTATQETE